jgi:RNA polymerase sigma factor for flagellar operon FliA
MDLQELVCAYKAKPSSLLKSQIITESLPLVKSIVGKIKSPSSSLCENDDLINIGSIGLLQALENYTSDKEVKFNTFAFYRIRGNIIDYLRSIDELSRTNRARFGAAQEAIRTLQQKLGRTPFNHEVAKELDLDILDYEKLLSSVQQRVALSLDFDSDPHSDNTLSDRLEDQNHSLPDQNIIEKENSKQIKLALESLPEREQLILALYYYEDYNLKEIATTLDLSEARISQILGKILLTLKSSLHQVVVA